MTSPGPAVPTCGPSPGPALAADRAVTAAVALDDGRALLAGHTSAPALSGWSALLDARAGTMTDVPMRQDQLVARLVQTSTGAVIALARRTVGGPVTAAARFDVATRTWSALADLPPCVSDDAPSLSGYHATTVELAAMADGEVIVVGHRCAARLTADGGWVRAPSPPPTRAFTLTRLEDGDLLRIGGLRTLPGDVALEATRDATRYDAATQRWTAVAAAPYLRFDHAAAALPDGRVLVVGGCEASVVTCHAEHRAAPPATIYDPATDRWEVLGAGPLTNRERSSATVLGDGRVVILGGFVDDEGRVAAPGAAYRDGRWAELPGLGLTRAGHAALAAGTHVLVAGSSWDDGPQLQWFGAAPSCPVSAAEFAPAAPPLAEPMP